MNLKNRHWGRIALIVVGILVAGLVLAFFLRVMLWEKDYYEQKKGSERAQPEHVEIEGVVDETPITEEQIVEYTVAPGNPRYLTIGGLGVSQARIIQVGTLKNGEMGTPNSIFDAGWYNQTARPGDGGKILIDGHNGGPTRDGIFKHLPELELGNIVSIERGDGMKFDYRVTESLSREVANGEASAEMLRAFQKPKVETVVMITCAGDWLADEGTYSHRQFVYAELVTE